MTSAQPNLVSPHAATASHASAPTLGAGLAPTMRALLLEGSRVHLTTVRTPTLQRSDDVIIRVQTAGLCRTDLYVAAGIVPVRSPLILGHEFSGVVHTCGKRARISPGDRVTVNPAIPCGTCASCCTQQPLLCGSPAFLGLARDGAFAEFICVPDGIVHRLPDSVDFRRGAYAEPVAASIAVLHSGIEPHERGLIFGRNRIAELTLRILRSRGFTAVEIWEPAPGEALESRACAYDFVIETVASAESFAVILELLRARGRFVLKSRKQQPVPLNIARAVQKEIFFSSVNYGDFDDALALLAGEALAVEDLFGQSHPLDDFEAVFAAGERGEALKLFFEPGSRR